MSQTIEQLRSMRVALVAARATGERRVRYDGQREVEYKTDAEMAAALAFLDAEISKLDGSRTVVTYFSHDKGFSR